jgi:hypothetical protein
MIWAEAQKGAAENRSATAARQRERLRKRRGVVMPRYHPICKVGGQVRSTSALRDMKWPVVPWGMTWIK